MTAKLKIHRFAKSGHSHRAVLFASLLGLDAELIDVDLAGGAHKTPDYLAMHPFGQVPVLQEGDQTIWDSNAILVHLAINHDASGAWYPQDQRAAIQAWLSVAAGPLFNGPCAARLVTVFGADFDHERTKATAAALFEVLEKELGKRPFLVGDKPTIADVALYSYTAHAPEGGVTLEPFENIRAWLSRIEALPGFVAMPETKAGLLA
ncbi:glutathione S-transferase [Rhizobiales bacterium]|uniref:glutathione S-transferase family protein n=1 Tax=Hongsoonwoonella zoysiae TaxID=2821844 RepID=UPI0015618B85|nr:glutathione S-transferase [Hongsoonwoonella zoysiae]NRG17488.1 glutathione S-transferase [Hongsoonwoonella zoysiae]